jgi:hypothetical protein
LGTAGLESSPVSGEWKPGWLEVPAQTIEQTAETIGADIAKREQEDIAPSKQLVLPSVA